MEWTTEKLAEVEKLGGLFYSLKKISIIMEIELDELQKLYADTNSPFYKSYMRSFLLTDAQIRTSEIAMAKRGSTPAQESVKKYIDDAKHENL